MSGHCMKYACYCQYRNLKNTVLEVMTSQFPRINLAGIASSIGRHKPTTKAYDETPDGYSRRRHTPGHGWGSDNVGHDKSSSQYRGLPWPGSKCMTPIPRRATSAVNTQPPSASIAIVWPSTGSDHGRARPNKALATSLPGHTLRFDGLKANKFTPAKLWCQSAVAHPPMDNDEQMQMPYLMSNLYCENI